MSYSGDGVKLAMLDIAVLPNTFFPGVSCTPSPEGFSALAFYLRCPSVNQCDVETKFDGGRHANADLKDPAQSLEDKAWWF